MIEKDIEEKRKEEEEEGRTKGARGRNDSSTGSSVSHVGCV